MSRDDFNIKEKYYANDVFIPDVVKILEEGHTVTLKLRGISMRPFLEDNRDKALITKARNLKRGDIVLAEVAPKLSVLHRIVKIDADNVVLRGDGNLNCEYCKLSDVKGFVIGFYRKGRSRLDKTNGCKWIVYSFLWTNLLPFRRYLLAIHRRLCNINVH